MKGVNKMYKNDENNDEINNRRDFKAVKSTTTLMLKNQNNQEAFWLTCLKNHLTLTLLKPQPPQPPELSVLGGLLTLIQISQAALPSSILFGGN
jgi:hypothetical protein